jgi:inhibitor of cysteine peptidase
MLDRRKSGMVQREIKRKTGLYGTAAVLSAIMLISMIYVFGVAPIILPPSQAPAAGAMKTFSSSQEIADYLNTNTHGFNSYRGGPVDNRFFGELLPIPMPVPQVVESYDSHGIPTSSDYSNGGYSTTNIQVSGVDEADTVKTDGQYIYVASSSIQTSNFVTNIFSSDMVNSVSIVEADPQNARVVSKITLDNTTEPAGLFLSQDSTRLIVIASKYHLYTYGPEPSGPIPTPMLGAYSSDVYTFIDVYDISNKAEPVLTRNFTVSGSYFNSRMIGNNVYTIISQPAAVTNNIVTLPAVYDGENRHDASPTSIYYADMNDSSFTFTSFYSLNILDDNSAPANMTVMMGGASTMYVSPQNFYVTYRGWDQNLGQYTSIYRVGINGLQLSLEAQGSVPGNVLNQYAMDEYNRDFRVATNYYATESQVSNVYVLTPDLVVTGKLEGLAPNENLHSVRFMGDKCYLVTFKTTDPLFVIDLSDSGDPKVLGELKIPGYSDYLHPYDETHLIGVGKEAVEAEKGDFAWYQGLKLSLFDVSDVSKPAQLTSYGIGDRGTDSAALSDPHAFLFDKEKSLLVIPVSLALVSDADRQQQGDSAYGKTVWQGAYVFSLSIDGGFTLKGTVTHLNPALLDSQGHLRNSGDYYSAKNDWITRSLYIGNTLYTISNAEIKLTKLTDMSPAATVSLI